MTRGAHPMAMRMVLLGSALAALAGCNGSKSGQDDGAGKAHSQIVKSESVPAEVGGIEGATPMAQRVAVVSLLNKRNGLVNDLTMKPGDVARVGRAIIRLRACETTAPWEDLPETGAFVQLSVQDQRDDKWMRVFSGWLFKERPDRNVIQHPIYDVFVKSCAMTYPGGEAVAVKPAASVPTKASSAPQSPAGNGGEGGTDTPPAPTEAAPPPPPPAPSPTPPAKTE